MCVHVYNSYPHAYQEIRVCHKKSALPRVLRSLGTECTHKYSHNREKTKKCQNQGRRVATAYRDVIWSRMRDVHKMCGFTSGDL